MSSNEENKPGDFLSYERTILAQERTWLAYIRTVLSLMVAGVGFIQLLLGQGAHIIGVLLITTSIFLLVYGIRSYRRSKNRADKYYLR